MFQPLGVLELRPLYALHKAAGWIFCHQVVPLPRARVCLARGLQEGAAQWLSI
jgi:hypothetical protein